MSTPFYLSYVALWILVIIQSLILLGLVRMVYQLQQSSPAGAGRSDEGMATGQEAPPFSAVDLSGTPINSADLSGRVRALLFVSPTCQPCIEVLEEDMPYLNHKANGNVIVVCRAGRAACARLAEKHRLNVPVLADEDDTLTQLYHVTSVPTVVLIDANDRIQSYGQPERNGLAELFTDASQAESSGSRLTS